MKKLFLFLMSSLAVVQVLADDPIGLTVNGVDVSVGSGTNPDWRYWTDQLYLETEDGDYLVSGCIGQYDDLYLYVTAACVTLSDLRVGGYGEVVLYSDGQCTCLLSGHNSLTSFELEPDCCDLVFDRAPGLTDEQAVLDLSGYSGGILFDSNRQHDSIEIRGGTLNVRQSKFSKSPAIGSIKSLDDPGGYSGKVIVSGGIVTAIGSSGGAGIGGCGDWLDTLGVQVEIRGGRVYAKGGEGAAAIGGGANSVVGGQAVRISGGTVIVDGWIGGAGERATNVTIVGGSVFRNTNDLNRVVGGADGMKPAANVIVRGSWPTDRALDVSGLPSWYGTKDIYATNGVVSLWLPADSYLFAVEGMLFEAVVPADFGTDPIEAKDAPDAFAASADFEFSAILPELAGQTATLDFCLFSTNSSVRPLWGRRIAVKPSADGTVNVRLADNAGQTIDADMTNLGNALVVAQEWPLWLLVRRESESLFHVSLPSVQIAGVADKVRRASGDFSAPQGLIALQGLTANDLSAGEVMTFMLTTETDVKAAGPAHVVGTLTVRKGLRSTGPVSGATMTVASNATVRTTVAVKNALTIGTLTNVTSVAAGSQITVGGVNVGVPPGTIVAWSGSTVPDGWVICNGENNTPDLRDRFVVGAGALYGCNVKEDENKGADTVALTLDQIPSHRHKLPYRFAKYSAARASYYYEVIGTGGSYEKWNGDVNAEGANTPAGHENLPPYYPLYYIMRKKGAAK